MGLRTKALIFWVFTETSDFQVESSQKIGTWSGGEGGGGCLKRREEPGQFADLQGRLAKKGGDIFEEGGDTPMHTMFYNLFLYIKFSLCILNSLLLQV